MKKLLLVVAVLFALAPKARALDNVSPVALRISSGTQCSLYTVGTAAVDVFGSTNSFNGAFFQNWHVSANILVGPASGITYDLTTARGGTAGVWLAPGTPGGSVTFPVVTGKTMYAIASASGAKLLVCGWK